MLKIQNNHKLIASTNYYESDYAKNGYCYLSFNAACFRLLVAPSLLTALPDMRSAKKVLVGYGESAQHQRKMIRALFEDYSDSPYLIDLSREQCDILLNDCEKRLEFAVYVPSGLAFTKPCEWVKIELMVGLANSIVTTASNSGSGSRAMTD